MNPYKIVIGEMEVMEVKDITVDKDWRAIAQDRDKWNAMVESRVNDLNAEAEDLEKKKKDERKERREIYASTDGIKVP